MRDAGPQGDVSNLEYDILMMRDVESRGWSDSGRNEIQAPSDSTGTSNNTTCTVIISLPLVLLVSWTGT